jgi:hypothetical protein
MSAKALIGEIVTLKILDEIIGLAMGICGPTSLALQEKAACSAAIIGKRPHAAGNRSLWLN